MADSFDEGTAFYRDHKATWDGFVKWGTRGVVFTAILVIIAFIFIVS